LEDGLKEAAGIKEIRSVSMNSFSNVVIELEAGTDIDQATQEIRNKILSVEGELPEDAEKTQVHRWETGGSAYVLALSGSENLSATVDSVTAAVSSMSEIKSVKPLIGKEKRVVIEVDPQKLGSTGLGLDELINIIKGANINFPVTRLDLDEKNQTLMVIGALESVSELEQVTIGLEPRSNTRLTLSDVARVTIDETNGNLIDRFGSGNGDRLKVTSGALLAIELADGADIIRTRQKLNDRLDQLKQTGDIPGKTRIEYIVDEARETQKQVDELSSGAIGNRQNLWLLGGIQLVLIIMLLFVNFRAAVLAAAAIPLSLGFTFISLWAMGITLNTVVLFSLILVLGLIVDPAVVIVESIQHYRDLGYKARDAVRETARRYGAGVFAATLTNLMVFVPFGVVSGIFGEIIRFIPLTIMPALVASYFLPIAILPLLSERFIKPRAGAGTDEVASLWGAARAMIAVNRWILARPWRQLLVVVAVGALTIFSVSLVASGKVRVVQFSMPEDNDRLMVNLTFDKGLTDEKRESIAKKLEKRLESEPGIRNFYYPEQSRDSLTAFIHLRDERAPEDRSKKIVSRLNKSLSDKPGFAFRAAELSYGPPESDYQIQVQLYDDNLDSLKKAAVKVGAFLEGVEGVQKVDDGVNSSAEPEVRVVLDRREAEARGLSGFQVGQVLKALLDETKVTKFDDQKDDRTLDVVLKVDGGNRPTLSRELNDLTLTDRLGEPVRLAEVAKVESTNSLAKVERFEGRRFLTVKARVDEERLFDIQSRLDSHLTPERIKALGISGTGNRGEYEDIAKSFRELFIALAIAVGLTYLVLVLQFRSFAQPMIMLFTIPPSVIGVFPALWLLGSQFGFLELLGLTILVGIVENVAIFLMDYANQRIREDGMDPREAIVLASGVRFRPIVLTNLVTLGALLPLAVTSPFWRGLSVTIMAGIGLSGIFSMVIIPILFMAIVSLEKRLGFEL
jgi:multidrug efflux pump subunit AcrB